MTLRVRDIRGIFMKRPLTFFLAAVLAAGCLGGCGKKTGGEEIVVPIYKTDKIDYNTVKAEIGDISQKYFVEGRFDYPYSEKVAFKMGGIIESIEVEDNADVKKGDVLCTLNSDDLQQKLDEKMVYLERARKTVRTLRSEGGTAKEIQYAETQVELLELEYEHLQSSEDEYKVFAPCDGVFRAGKNTSFGADISDQRGAENIIVKGAQVSADQQFGYITNHSQKYIICEVYDFVPENINFGTRVKLQQGKVEEEGRVVDILTGSNAGMSVTTYVITPPEKTELGDMQINCVFEVYSKLDTVIVPSDAVKTSKDRTYVNLLVDGTKIEQDVETGIEDGEKTEILSGLSGGEEVIVGT